MEIKIKIKIKDVEIEVDQKDLKELYEFLDSMFGGKQTQYIPYVQPWYPPYIEPSPWVPYTPSWNTTSGSVTLNCSIGE